MPLIAAQLAFATDSVVVFTKDRTSTCLLNEILFHAWSVNDFSKCGVKLEDTLQTKLKNERCIADLWMNGEEAVSNRAAGYSDLAQIKVLDTGSDLNITFVQQKPNGDQMLALGNCETK